MKMGVISAPPLSRTSSRASISDGSRASAAARRRFPRLLQVLRCTGGRLLAPMNVTLPSNPEFRMNNYFKLLTAQKARKERLASLSASSQPVVVAGIRPDWQTDVPSEPEPKRPRRTPGMTPDVVGWHAQDIVKAARLLLPEDNANAKTPQANKVVQDVSRNTSTQTNKLSGGKKIVENGTDDVEVNANNASSHTSSEGVTDACQSRPRSTENTESVDGVALDKTSIGADVTKESEPNADVMSADKPGNVAEKQTTTFIQSRHSAVQFSDEEEMRRVFTLLYDVFRYKTILKDALEETGFSKNHPEYKDMTCVVWLLLYELCRRRFLPREHADEFVCSQALASMGLHSVEGHLWQARVRLAAALARNRIAHRALRLNHLLPAHLQDERLLSVEHAPATAWINTFLTEKKDLVNCLNEMGISVQTADSVNSELEDASALSTGKFDHVCPKLLALPAACRSQLAKSHLVKANKLILQDRSFCLGATMLGRILQELSLQGTVVQSHVISPRATAYLTAVLLDNPNVDKVLAYGAAERTEEYKGYLERAGVRGCEVRPERWVDVAADCEALDDVVAVLATPPCSWTGVGDPVELVCSRSGDLAMLRALTQARRGRDPVILQQQRDTLTFSMSLPQVQVVVYESHSMSTEENKLMVESAVECMNEWARQKHAEEQRIIQEQEEAEEKQNKAMLPGGTPAERLQREKEAAEAQEARELTPLQVHVPLCDMFEVLSMPEVCSHGSECSEEEGCYIARIQRKEIIGLDAKYMIKIAEARGLFGTEPSHKKSATARAQRKKEELQRAQAEAERPKARRTKIEMDRIAAHTHASLIRCCSAELAAAVPCQRYTAHARDVSKRVGHLRHALMRSWWQQAMMYIVALLPYERLTPRTRAALPPIAPLRLPRICPRRPLPMHKVLLPCDVASLPGGNARLCDKPDYRRNSC